MKIVLNANEPGGSQMPKPVTLTIVAVLLATLTAQGQTAKVIAVPVPAAEGIEKIDKIPPAEKREAAAKFVAESKQVLVSVTGVLKEAREKKDIIRINCVNDKLTRIKALARSAEMTELYLREALTKKDDKTANTSYLKLTTALSKIRALKSEAEQCIGELAFAKGDKKEEVDLRIDRDKVPDDDPTVTEFPETAIVRPPAASPYQ
jgi:hypothetical protein